jgi:hypothetical protein
VASPLAPSLARSISSAKTDFPIARLNASSRTAGGRMLPEVSGLRACAPVSSTGLSLPSVGIGAVRGCNPSVAHAPKRMEHAIETNRRTIADRHRRSATRPLEPFRPRPDVQGFGPETSVFFRPRLSQVNCTVTSSSLASVTLSSASQVVRESGGRSSLAATEVESACLRIPDRDTPRHPRARETP